MEPVLYRTELEASDITEADLAAERRSVVRSSLDATKATGLQKSHHPSTKTSLPKRRIGDFVSTNNGATPPRLLDKTLESQEVEFPWRSMMRETALKTSGPNT